MMFLPHLLLPFLLIDIITYMHVHFLHAMLLMSFIKYRRGGGSPELLVLPHFSLAFYIWLVLLVWLFVCCDLALLGGKGEGTLL